MANPVTQIFSEMTNHELIQAIKEMKEDDLTGITRAEGILREKCKIIHSLTGGNVYEHLTMVRFSIIQEAAYRFTPN